MGGLPRTATEDQLREFAEAVGEVRALPKLHYIGADVS